MRSIVFRRGMLRAIRIVSLAACLPAIPAPAAETKRPAGDDSATWIAQFGEEWFKHQHTDYEGWFPGGRSNRLHDLYIAKLTGKNPLTVDWRLFHKTYTFDGDWYAVEWFYQATYVSDGFRQWESTLGIGRVQDGKQIVWIEYFDDMVGHLQRLGMMPFFSDDEEVFPWPAKAKLSLPYRP